MYRIDDPKTTEWDDLQRKVRGEKTEKEIADEKRELQEALNEAFLAAQEKAKFDHLSLEELDEMEDDLDEDYLEELRQQRKAELMERAQRARFGKLMQIRGPEYVSATHQTGVNCVLHLCQEYLPDCRIVNARLSALARKFPEVKFVWITATEANEKYPDSLCPTLVLYKDGKAVKKLTGLFQIGGKNLTEDELEYTLAENEILDTELERDPRGIRTGGLSSQITLIGGNL